MRGGVPSAHERCRGLERLRGSWCSSEGAARSANACRSWPVLHRSFARISAHTCCASCRTRAQALRALAKDKPAEDLQAALPSWAYLFGRLVMDGNRAVRAEACHVTAALAAAVGRGIAPLLKSLLPPLWLAQFDAYGEAAAAARGAFAAAFPAPAKQREALLFCRTEVGVLAGGARGCMQPGWLPMACTLLHGLHAALRNAFAMPALPACTLLAAPAVCTAWTSGQ